MFLKRLILPGAIFGWYLLLSRLALAQNTPSRTFCNPLDLGYKYDIGQISEARQVSCRSGADPVLITFKSEYYLFVTNSAGYWHSLDLANWEFVKPNLWPAGDMCAPAALAVGDTLYLLPSFRKAAPIFISTAPRTGHWEIYNPGLIGPGLYDAPDDTLVWDPALFWDAELQRAFIYFGSSNVYPLYVVELNRQQRFSPVQHAKILPCIALQPTLHGWERFGFNHTDSLTQPFIEGAWMTYYHGQYFLQYAAPGTEYNGYANGAYLAAQPIGPFRYAPYNPIAYKPGGYLTGAGHGSTASDNFGNFWNLGTGWIGINNNFERRVVLFPAGFDADDQMYVNTRFGDYPQFAPTTKRPHRHDGFTGWMLLSYRKKATASSVHGNFTAELAVDEDPRTFWVAQTKNASEWLAVDLRERFQINALQINFTDYQSAIYRNDEKIMYHQFRIYTSNDGQNWQILIDLSQEKRDRPNAYFELQPPVQARYVKYENIYVPPKHLALGDFRIFGQGSGRVPMPVQDFRVRRAADRRNVFLKWAPVSTAIGYNVRWGIAPDKLYQTLMVYTSNEYELRALTVDQRYFFAIEAFNEHGVSEVSDPVRCE
ncbi:discoidin domain-containing protein [candidate division KSB1 bacterium]|nr:discoidin domain-containing protein [candidate division KSB1 bacterium]